MFLPASNCNSGYKECMYKVDLTGLALQIISISFHKDFLNMFKLQKQTKSYVPFISYSSTLSA